MRCEPGVCVEVKAVAVTKSATGREGDVDVEDPAPGDVVDQEAADQRTGDARQREDTTQQPW